MSAMGIPTRFLGMGISFRCIITMQHGNIRTQLVASKARRNACLDRNVRYDEIDRPDVLAETDKSITIDARAYLVVELHWWRMRPSLDMRP
jgi:hypothetical protein